MQVETGGCEDPLNAVGDNGRSLGPFQIGEPYYNDAVGFNPSLQDGGRTYANVMGPGSMEYSMEVMQSYMDLYATENRLGRPVTDEDIARIHNGGPNGYQRDSTDIYWERVEPHLDNDRKRQATDLYVGCPECDQAINDLVDTPCNNGASQSYVASKIAIILTFTTAVVCTCM